MFTSLRTYRLGTLFGFPIEVNLSFLAIPIIALLFWGGLSGLLGVVILFTSVVLHELGHALTARRYNVPVVGIELHLLGGAAKMVGQPKRANEEVLIAAAGPAVSFILGAAGLLLSPLSAAIGLYLAADLLQVIGWINIILGIFNLLPALPMDGGRILRALLTRKYEYARATEISVKISRGLAIVIAVYALFQLSLWLLLLAPFLWIMGAQELHMAQISNHHFSYDKQGYRRYDFADVEVMPPGFADVGDSRYDQPDPFAQVLSFGWPSFGGSRRGAVSFGRYVVRRRNGRIVLESLD